MSSNLIAGSSVQVIERLIRSQTVADHDSGLLAIYRRGKDVEGKI